MNNEQIIENMKKLIADLSAENEKLKTENEAMKLTLTLSEKSYAESTQNAKELITACDTAISEYREAIDGAHQAKKEYEKAVREINILKKEYEIKMKDFFNQL